MGLDMYLTKKIYVGAHYNHRNVTGRIEIFVDGEPLPVNFTKVSSIDERAGYWRKANQIHSWMVRNIQDDNDNCGEYYLSEDNMNELLNVVNEVLEDHSKAENLLPSQSGFFFGETEYDEWYFKDLEYTKELLVNALSDTNGEYYYSSSW